MKRRKILSCFVMVVVLISLAFVTFDTTPAEAQRAAKTQVITWKVQGCTPTGTLFQTWLEEFAESIKVITQGRMVLEVYPAGAIVPPLEGMNAVRDGILDVHWGYAGMWLGIHDAAPLFCSIPGGFHAQDTLMWMRHGGGIELYNELFSRFNAHIIVGGVVGMEIFMWSNKRLETIDDMKGLRIRMMPLMGEILAANGLSMAFLPGGELIPALERKVLDAAEFSIPAFDITLGFQHVAQYYHYPGIHQPTGVLELAINKDKWNALPDDLKQIFQYAADAACLRIWMSSEADSIHALEKFEEMGREQVLLNPEDVKTMMKWSEEWLDKKAKENEFFGKVRTSQIEFSKWWYPYKHATTLPIPEWALEK